MVRADGGKAERAPAARQGHGGLQALAWRLDRPPLPGKGREGPAGPGRGRDVQGGRRGEGLGTACEVDLLRLRVAASPLGASRPIARLRTLAAPERAARHMNWGYRIEPKVYVEGVLSLSELERISTQVSADLVASLRERGFDVDYVGISVSKVPSKPGDQDL